MTTQRSVGYIVIAVVFGGALFFVWNQIRHGRKEAGSEIELAANRKEYINDEQLEGKKLNLALWSAFGLLIVIGVTLPVYWLAEGGRQEGARASFDTIFAKRGKAIYEKEAKCEGCHGPTGAGGAATFVITDENGEYKSTVNWKAPALDTVLWRYSVSEVREVLVYGRPGSPMQPWGVVGGGALSDQQLDNVIDYLWTFQLTPEQMAAEVDKALVEKDSGLAERLAKVKEQNVGKLTDPLAYECDSKDFACLSNEDNLRLGEILFNLGDVAAGGYACSRCHVPGASYGQPWLPIDQLARGRFAPNLIGIENNLTVRQHFQLIMKGSEFGKSYGSNSLGSGRMPGFGTNANLNDAKTPQLGATGMLSPEEVWAIVVYERALSTQRPDLAAVGKSPLNGTSTNGTSTSPTTTAKPAAGTPASASGN